MKTSTFLAVFLAALSMTPAARAGLFDNIEQQAKQAFQQSVQNTKNAAKNTTNNIINETNDTADKKMQDVTGSVNNHINNATNNLDNHVNNATNNLNSHVNNAVSAVQNPTHGSAPVQRTFSAAPSPARTLNRNGAYGPDMVGLRLGMTMSQAENIVRRHMQVGWVATLRPGILGANNAKFIRGMPKIFIARNEREVIILLSHPKAGNRVLGVRRLLMLPGHGLDPAALKRKLKAKYGPTSTPGTLTWGGDSKCVANWRGVAMGAFKFADGNDPTKPATFRDSSGAVSSVLGMQSLLFQPVPLQQRILAGSDGHQCRPVLHADVSRNVVDLSLADKGQLYQVFDKAKAASLQPQPAAPTLSNVQF